MLINRKWQLERGNQLAIQHDETYSEIQLSIYERSGLLRYFLAVSK
jgi:hypothetical protein